MEQYYLVTDGTVTYRFGCRNAEYVVDRTLTVVGFNGVEDQDWENLKQLTLS